MTAPAKRTVMVRICQPYVDTANTALQILGAQRVLAPPALRPAPESTDREILIPVPLPVDLLDDIASEVGPEGSAAFDLRLSGVVLSSIVELASLVTGTPLEYGGN